MGTENYPTYEISSTYYKLYDADGEKEVLLTAQEASDLLDYLQYVMWLTNPPEGMDWHRYLKERDKEYKKFYGIGDIIKNFATYILNKK